LREKPRWLNRRERIVGSDTPPDVPPSPLKPHEGRISGLRQYHSESEKERVKQNFVVTGGGESSGEFTLAPTLWTWWIARVKERVLLDGYISVHDAIYQTAREMKQKFGYGSSVTTRRYLKEVSSDPKNGDFEKKWHQTFGWIVVFTEKAERRLEISGK
jgi:hypothetical protein